MARCVSALGRRTIISAWGLACNLAGRVASVVSVAGTVIVGRAAFIRRAARDVRRVSGGRRCLACQMRGYVSTTSVSRVRQ